MPIQKPLVAALIATGFAIQPAQADDLADLKAKMRQLDESSNRTARQIEELEKRLEAAGSATATGQQSGSAGAPHQATDRFVTAGDVEGSWKLPGSETSVSLYGFIHLDAYVDAKGRQTGDWAADIGSQPVTGVPSDDARNGKFNLTARTSRLGLKTLTPSGSGSVSTVLEGDFNKNASGSDGVLNNTLITSNYAFRLRLAYGELDGAWGKLLAGQNWSTFMNLDSTAETVDFNGHASAAYVRQAMIRYVAKLGTAGELALAIENPHGSFDGGAAQSTPYIDTRPDLIANWYLANSWGSFSAQGLSTEYRYDDGNVSAKASGYGVGFGGALRPTSHDTLLFQLTVGKGIGRYVPTTSYHIASYDAAANTVRLYRSSSYTLGWSRNWSDTLRTNFAAGATRIRDNWDSNFSDGFIDSRKMAEMFANVILKIAKNTEWGLEYSWGSRRTYAWTSGPGATGLTYSGLRSRYQTSLHFAF